MKLTRQQIRQLIREGLFDMFSPYGTTSSDVKQMRKLRTSIKDINQSAAKPGVTDKDAYAQLDQALHAAKHQLGPDNLLRRLEAFIKTLDVHN